MAYLLDTHGANAMHVVSLVNSGRDLAVCGATFFANGFIAARGIKTSLVILCACQAVSSLAAVAMYVYGKRVRSFVSLRIAPPTHAHTLFLTDGERECAYVLPGGTF